MAQAPPDVGADGSQSPPGGQRLDSWKEIAAYLRRDVATVRRWEKREALPVHRHHHEKQGSVYAYASELDAWLEGRRQQVEHQPGRRLGREPALWVAIAAILFVTIAGLGYRLRESGRTEGSRPRLRLAVHRPGTVASLIAGGLYDLLTRKLSGVDVELVEQTGMTSTLRALDSGQVDLGLAFNLLAFHAVKTELVLGHRSDAITALTVAYATPAQIVVRTDSDVKTIADLKGKRISLGIADSGERFCSQILLSHLGFGAADISDQFIDFDRSLANLLEGRLDAYITWRGLPVPDVAQGICNRKASPDPAGSRVASGPPSETSVSRPMDDSASRVSTSGLIGVDRQRQDSVAGLHVPFVRSGRAGSAGDWCTHTRSHCPPSGGRRH